MQRRKQRERISNHMLEDDKEELFLSLKTRIQVLADLGEVYNDDEDMALQLYSMREELKDDLFKLLRGGVDLMELYKRFGSVLFKSKVLQGQEAIERLTKKRELPLVDLVNEDAILQQRLARVNDPQRLMQEQRLRAGVGANLIARQQWQPPGGLPNIAVQQPPGQPPQMPPAAQGFGPGQPPQPPGGPGFLAGLQNFFFGGNQPPPQPPAQPPQRPAQQLQLAAQLPQRPVQQPQLMFRNQLNPLNQSQMTRQSNSTQQRIPSSNSTVQNNRLFPLASSSSSSQIMMGRPNVGFGDRAMIPSRQPRFDPMTPQRQQDYQRINTLINSPVRLRSSGMVPMRSPLLINQDSSIGSIRSQQLSEEEKQLDEFIRSIPGAQTADQRNQNEFNRLSYIIPQMLVLDKDLLTRYVEVASQLGLSWADENMSKKIFDWISEQLQGRDNDHDYFRDQLVERSAPIEEAQDQGLITESEYNLRILGVIIEVFRELNDQSVQTPIIAAQFKEPLDTPRQTPSVLDQPGIQQMVPQTPATQQQTPPVFFILPSNEEEKKVIPEEEKKSARRPRVTVIRPQMQEENKSPSAMARDVNELERTQISEESKTGGLTQAFTNLIQGFENSEEYEKLARIKSRLSADDLQKLEALKKKPRFSLTSKKFVEQTRRLISRIPENEQRDAILKEYDQLSQNFNFAENRRKASQLLQSIRQMLENPAAQIPLPQRDLPVARLRIENPRAELSPDTMATRSRARQPIAQQPALTFSKKRKIGDIGNPQTINESPKKKRLVSIDPMDQVQAIDNLQNMHEQLRTNQLNNLSQDQITDMILGQLMYLDNFEQIREELIADIQDVWDSPDRNAKIADIITTALQVLQELGKQN